MTYINKEIEINAFYFSNHRGFKTFPKSITVDNQQLSFVESGLQYLIKKGEDVVRLFDMTDGTLTYRLRNSGDQWILVGTRSE